MALVKTVEMRILADAGDAQAKLDELDAKAKDLDGNAIKMRFRLDDGDGKAQLDDIRARADELGFKDVSIRVRVDGAGRAIAELDAVKHEEDKVRDESILDKLLMMGGGGAGGGGGMPMMGPLPLPALMAIIPAIGAALVETTGLVSGFAAAGAGAGAFALLAIPAVKSVENAQTSLNTAMQKYHQAQATEAINPTKANAAAVKTALANVNLAGQAFAKLPVSEQKASDGIYQLTRSFSAMSRAFEPQAFKIFADGLKIANNLLPAATPFANTFANALDGLLKKAGQFTQSKGFKQFLDQFRGIEGPAVTAIGTGIGHVANSVGKLLTTMSGKDVAQTIGIAFNAISGTISGVSFVVRRLMQNWDGMMGAAKASIHGVASAFDAVRRSGAVAGHDVAHAFDAGRHGVADFGHNVAAHFDEVRHNIADFGHNAAAHFDEARHAVASFGHGAASVFDGVRHSIGSTFTQLFSGPHPGGHAFDTIRHDVAAAVDSAMSGLGHAGAASFDSVRHAAASAFDGIVSDAKAAPAKIVAAFAHVGHDIASKFDSIRHDVASDFDAVVAYVKGIPGKIISALAALPGMMLRAGVHAMESLISGIESMAGKIGSTMAGIASKVAGFFGLSPAKEGPLSAGGAPWIRGQHLVQDIAGGMLSAQPGLASAAARIAGTASAAGSAGGRGGSGGGNIEVHFNGLVTNPQDAAKQVVQVLREYKRNGGNAQLGIA